MKTKKDIHGTLNLLIGITLAFLAALYFSELPKPVHTALFEVSTFLIARELWLMGGQEKWSIIGK